MEVRKLGSLVALIFSTYVKFLDFSFFNWIDKFTTVSLALLPTSTTSLSSALNGFRAKFNDLVAFNGKVNGVPTLITSLSSAVNTFGAESDDAVAFNSEVSGAITLLKLYMKRQ